MQLPDSIQQELISPSGGGDHKPGSSPGTTMSRSNTSGSHSGSMSVIQGGTLPGAQGAEATRRNESVGASSAAGAPPDPDEFPDDFAESWQAVVKYVHTCSMFINDLGWSWYPCQDHGLIMA